MRSLEIAVVVALAAALGVGCGKSEEEKAAEKAAADAKAAAEATAKAVESAGAPGVAQGLQAFAKAVEGAAVTTGPDGKPIQPVAFEGLITVLPDVSGWQREDPSGERMTVPVPFSQAEATYKKGDAQIEMKIVDSAFSQLLVAPWAMFLTEGFQRTSSDGYEKSVTVAGNPGFEKWDSSSKDGELNLVIAKRFLVTIEGDAIADTNVLHEFASKVDVGKLTRLK